MPPTYDAVSFLGTARSFGFDTASLQVIEVNAMMPSFVDVPILPLSLPATIDTKYLEGKLTTPLVYSTATRSCILVGGLAYLTRVNQPDERDNVMTLTVHLELRRPSLSMGGAKGHPSHNDQLKGCMTVECSALEFFQKPKPLVDVLSGTIVFHDQHVIEGVSPWRIGVFRFN